MLVARVATAVTITLAGPADAEPQGKSVQIGEPVIACASLANLRNVLRTAKDDQKAALPIVTDPKSDLGCTPLDRSQVVRIVDHVALNGRAYDCLGLRNTTVCQWTLAGSVQPDTFAKSTTDDPASGSQPPGKGQSKPKR